MVAGDVMNTAARIQAAAPIDGILVSARDASRDGARDRLPGARRRSRRRARPSRSRCGRRSRRSGASAGSAQESSSPLVGRDHERALLLGAFARVRVDRSPQLVTLVGVPGIGKSRLVAELGRRRWRTTRRSSPGATAAASRTGTASRSGRSARSSRRRRGSTRTTTRATTAAKLARAVDELVPEAERRWVASSLEPLVGLVPEDVGLRDRRAELFAGWRIFLESLAERRPLVLVIDDLQWADDGLLDFVDGLVDLVEGVPLLVVACARPELLERRPDWGGGKRNALTVSLGPLSADETARLVESLLGRDPADDDAPRSGRRAGGRQSALRRGVRPHADRGRRRRGAARQRARDRHGAGRPAAARGEGAAPRRRRDGRRRLVGRAARRVGAGRGDGRRAAALARAQGVPPARAALGGRSGRPSTPSSTRSSATRSTGSCRDPTGSTGTFASRGGSSRCPTTGARIAPSSSRTTTSRRSSSPAAPGSTSPSSSRRRRPRFARRACARSRSARTRRPSARFGPRPNGFRAVSMPRALRVLGKALIFTREQRARTSSGARSTAWSRTGRTRRPRSRRTTSRTRLLAARRRCGGAKWTARALELVAGSGPTFEHVDVLAQAARYKMLAGRPRGVDRDRGPGDRARRGVGAPGSACVRADHARDGEWRTPGDYDRDREDFEEALALARVHDRPRSLASTSTSARSSWTSATSRGAIEAAREGVAHAERTGTMGGFGRFALGNLGEALLPRRRVGRGGGDRRSRAGARRADRRAATTSRCIASCWASSGSSVTAAVDEAAAGARAWSSSPASAATTRWSSRRSPAAAWTLARTG